MSSIEMIWKDGNGKCASSLFLEQVHQVDKSQISIILEKARDFGAPGAKITDGTLDTKQSQIHAKMAMENLVNKHSFFLNINQILHLPADPATGLHPVEICLVAAPLPIMKQ